MVCICTIIQIIVIYGIYMYSYPKRDDPAVMISHKNVCRGFLLYLCAPWPETICLYFSSFSLSAATRLAVVVLVLFLEATEQELLGIRSM